MSLDMQGLRYASNQRTLKSISDAGVTVTVHNVGDRDIDSIKIEGTLAIGNTAFEIDGHYNNTSQMSHLSIDDVGEAWLESLELDITDFDLWLEHNRSAVK